MYPLSGEKTKKGGDCMINPNSGLNGSPLHTLSEAIRFYGPLAQGISIHRIKFIDQGQRWFCELNVGDRRIRIRPFLNGFEDSLEQLTEVVGEVVAGPVPDSMMTAKDLYSNDQADRFWVSSLGQ